MGLYNVMFKKRFPLTDRNILVRETIKDQNEARLVRNSQREERNKNVLAYIKKVESKQPLF